MANESTSSILFNPLMAWADIGLRALEMSVSSTQNMGDSLDRVARAVASEPTEAAASGSATPSESAAAVNGSAASAGTGLALANQIQRTTFDLMTQTWLQWMSMLGTAASLAAGQKDAARALGWGLPPVAAGTSATQAQAAGAVREQGGSRRESHAQTASKEHAHASAASQRRRSTTTARAKRKPRARNA